MPAMKPRVRSEQITVVQLDGEAVLYDERTGMLHHLNPEGTLLYRLCDGTATVRQLANEAGIDTVPGALWVWVEAQVAGPGPLSGSRLLAAFVIALLLAVFLLPRPAAGISPHIRIHLRE